MQLLSRMNSPRRNLFRQTIETTAEQKSRHEIVFASFCARNFGKLDDPNVMRNKMPRRSQKILATQQSTRTYSISHSFYITRPSKHINNTTYLSTLRVPIQPTRPITSLWMHTSGNDTQDEIHQSLETEPTHRPLFCFALQKQ